MKKQIFLITFFLACGICKGQNLVPNPSFEDTLSCPTMLDQVHKATSWHALANSPDYFNACSVTPQIGVPYNTLGFQFPHSGNAYMGLYTLSDSDTNYREVIGTYLISPLVIGKKYYVNFKVSFSAGTQQFVNIATNRIGLLFSTVDYLTTPPPINNFSQIYADSIIVDSLNWVTVKGSLIADSSYSFISIGNFFQNYLTDTLHLNPINHSKGYYYIDDVCISEDSLTCNSTVGINDPKGKYELILFPNPFSNELNITVKEHDAVELIIYDLTGRIIIKNSFRNSAVIKTGHLAKGLYLYEVRSREGIIKTGKIVKE